MVISKIYDLGTKRGRLSNITEWNQIPNTKSLIVANISILKTLKEPLHMVICNI